MSLDVLWMKSARLYPLLLAISPRTFLDQARPTTRIEHASAPHSAAGRSLAAPLRLSERLERLRVAGTGPRFVRAGGRSVRYREVDLEAWIASRVVGSTSEAVAR
jgi:hypothetical protein